MGRYDIQPVSSPELETLLAELSGSVSRPDEGIFGPHSISWKINRESALFLAAGRAALLQLAHPWVAAAIAQHSKTLNDPLARFHRTFRVIFTMVFGTTEAGIGCRPAAAPLHRPYAACCRMRSDNSARDRATRPTKSPPCVGCSQRWWTARCWPMNSYLPP